MKEQRELQIQKEYSEFAEKLLNSKGLQFIRSEVKAWWWSEPVWNYIYISDLDTYGEIVQATCKQYEDEMQKKYAANRAKRDANASR